MITRISDCVPIRLQKELLRLARMNRNWCRWVKVTDPDSSKSVMVTKDGVRVIPHLEQAYSCEVDKGLDTWIRGFWRSGGDAFSMWAHSIWLVDGPKIFRPTLEQCHALQQITVNIALEDYAQPYPAVLIDLPIHYEPFMAVLCHKSENLLTCVIHSRGHENDITTTVAQNGRPIEDSLQRVEPSLVDLVEKFNLVLRIAVNSCLALCNWEHYASYLYPKELERDARFAKECSTRGKEARERVATTPQLIRFNQEVKIHKTEEHVGEPGVGTGKEMPTHWRRGHWAMQAHGPHFSLRKRILRPPVLVRGDRVKGEERITTVYHS